MSSNGKQVVITGIGVIAPNGIGKENFWEALEKGRSGIGPATLIDTTYFKTKLAGECKEFHPEEFLGKKGLRNLDRTTTLVCSAAKLAIDDANLSISEENSYSIGVITATTLSVSWDMIKFTKEEVEAGFQFINPALFPPTTINFPSSQLSIRYHIKGFNTTISTGFTAGLDALKYGVDFIKWGRAKAVLVAGVESINFSNYVGFYKVGFLAGINGEEISCPFDKRHNGIILGEAGVVLVLEDKESALRRGVNIYAEVLGVKSSFDAYRISKYQPQAEGLKQCIVGALKAGGISEEGIDYICAAANSVPQQDRLETKAIKDVFHIYAKKIPVSSIKSMVGESISAAGLLQVCAGIRAINKQKIPPTVNYQYPDSECDLDYVANKSRTQEVKYVLVNCFGPDGHNTSAIIGKLT